MPKHAIETHRGNDKKRGPRPNEHAQPKLIATILVYKKRSWHDSWLIVEKHGTFDSRDQYRLLQPKLIHEFQGIGRPWRPSLIRLWLQESPRISDLPNTRKW